MTDFTPCVKKIVQLCNSPAAGSERFISQAVLRGSFDEAQIFDWAWRLWTQNDVDRLARRADVRKAARLALSELAPRIVENRGWIAWHGDARRILIDDQQDALMRELGF